MSKIIKTVQQTVLTKLGNCPRCMRQSLLAAAVAWAMAFGSSYVTGWNGTSLLLAAGAAALTGLWIAHLATYAARVVSKASSNRDEPGDARVNNTDPTSSVSRRDVIPMFIKTLLAAAAFTALPQVAWACVQPPIPCTSNSDCKCSGCCGDFGGSGICQPSC